MSKFAASIVFAVLTGAALTAPAHAAQFSVSTDATTLWASLRVTTGPGVAITWLDTSDQTQVFHFFDNQFVAYQSSPNLNPLLYDRQLGTVTTFGEATANSLSAGSVWSAFGPVVQPSGNDLIEVSRERNFQVTGSGTVTFAIDYSLAANRSIDASTLPYPYISSYGVVREDLSLYIPFVNTLATDSNYIFLPVVVGSVNDSLSQTGSATVQYQLSDGTYWIRADSTSVLAVTAPEPPTLLLLISSFSALGALFGARVLRDRRHRSRPEHP